MYIQYIYIYLYHILIYSVCLAYSSFNGSNNSINLDRCLVVVAQAGFGHQQGLWAVASSFWLVHLPDKRCWITGIYWNWVWWSFCFALIHQQQTFDTFDASSLSSCSSFRSMSSGWRTQRQANEPYLLHRWCLQFWTYKSAPIYPILTSTVNLKFRLRAKMPWSSTAAAAPIRTSKRQDRQSPQCCARPWSPAQCRTSNLDPETTSDPSLGSGITYFQIFSQWPRV